MILSKYKYALPLAAAVVLMAGTGVAQEQPENYPRRPINMIVAYPAGGGMDVAARTLGSLAEQQMGHEFRIENRTGGGGIVGHSYLANEARPDGHTLGVVANPFLFSDFLARDGSFDQDSFEPIAGINFDPVLWVVRSDSEILSYDSIVEAAKADPGRLTVGVIANNVFAFVTDIIAEAEEIELEQVPFQGGQPAVTALLRGDIDIANGFYAEVEQYIRNGDLVPIMVSNDERLEFLPDVPALTELGVDIPGRTWGASRFVTVPPETPEPVKSYLAEAFYSVLTSEDAATAFDEVGMTLSPTSRSELAEDYKASFEALSDFLSGQ